jgi:hypothetical protein
MTFLVSTENILIQLLNFFVMSKKIISFSFQCRSEFIWVMEITMGIRIEIMLRVTHR